MIDSDGEIEEIGVSTDGSTGGSHTSFANWWQPEEKGDKVAGKSIAESRKYLHKTADTDL